MYTIIKQWIKTTCINYNTWEFDILVNGLISKIELNISLKLVNQVKVQPSLFLFKFDKVFMTKVIFQAYPSKIVQKSIVTE